ncbi:hypothetical protein BD626DRAFT_6921 [Schizophyllum amplum]|uniref:Uncharacterized protein n=1 Tax=Schizophyllum amplum TaxID=97359 RepID=A0A550CWJ6_9AGAR|nr:hypothetical protein BD626DRAFT_6921 [Auriculariopsis ampla]
MPRISRAADQRTLEYLPVASLLIIQNLSDPLSDPLDRPTGTDLFLLDAYRLCELADIYTPRLDACGNDLRALLRVSRRLCGKLEDITKRMMLAVLGGPAAMTADLDGIEFTSLMNTTLAVGMARIRTQDEENERRKRKRKERRRRRRRARGRRDALDSDSSDDDDLLREELEEPDYHTNMLVAVSLACPYRDLVKAREKAVEEGKETVHDSEDETEEENEDDEDMEEGGEEDDDMDDEEGSSENEEMSDDEGSSENEEMSD